MQKRLCFALGALAGALGLFAYREWQAARELAALQDLRPSFSPPGGFVRPVSPGLTSSEWHELLQEQVAEAP